MKGARQLIVTPEPMTMSALNVTQLKTVPELVEPPLSMFEQGAKYGQDKAVKSPWQSFGLAVFAGAFIALAFVFYITVTTGATGAPWGLIRLAGGLAFSMGLILVVVCGGELFTSTVLTTIAWAKGSITTKQLLACWSRVYCGNFIGASLILGLVMWGGMWQLNGAQWGLNALHIAQHKLHHSWGQAFALGVLCNLLVCLGVWMTFSSKDALTKSALLILPVAMFVSSGFEHSIANLFMVPLGIAIEHFAGANLFAALGIPAGQFSDLTFSNFISHNLVPVTLGNIVGGGVVVGLGYWAVEKGSATKVNNIKQNSNYSESYGEGSTMKTAINNLVIRDVMDAQPVTLAPEMNVYQALELLAQSDVRSAPVVDQQQRLLGFISEQDLLRGMWSEEFSADLQLQVRDLMQFEMLTVAPSDSVAQLLELMIVDKDKLFPVSDSGMYIGSSYQSYEERLRCARANRPSAYPVVEGGRLCGVIRREHMLTKLVRTQKPEAVAAEDAVTSAA